jgi:hypothetical protein
MLCGRGNYRTAMVSDGCDNGIVSFGRAGGEHEGVLIPCPNQSLHGGSSLLYRRPRPLTSPMKGAWITYGPKARGDNPSNSLIRRVRGVGVAIDNHG